MWRDVAGCILKRVNNLGLNATLFLTDFKFLKLGGLPPIYQVVLGMGRLPVSRYTMV